MKKILCICFSATFQRTVSFNKLELTKVNRSEHYGLWASGKAVNSARILAQLDKNCVETICPLGKENLTDFVTLAEKDNLNLSYIEVPGKIRECWTLLDRNSGTTTELVVGETDLSGWTDKACQAAEVKLLKLITEKLPEVDAVLLAGSRQGVWATDLYSTIAGIAADYGKIFLADYVGNDLRRTLDVCKNIIIKINDEEFCSTFLTDDELKSFYSLEEEKRTTELKNLIIKKSKELNDIIIVTRGTSSTLAADSGEFYECPIQKVNAVNTTACGDSFNAAFLYEYINSKDIQTALKKGTWCASRNAEKEAPGTIQ